MKKPNAYLQKQEMQQQQFLNVGMDTGFQKCWDLLQIVLHDPEVMGKDTFGKGRIKKAYLAMKKLEHDLGKAWLTEVDSDVCQRDLDSALREIWGDELCPFEDRYPYIRKPDYNHGKKKWRQ